MKIPEASAMKGKAAVQIKESSQPLIKATKNPKINIEIVMMKVGTFSPMAPYYIFIKNLKIKFFSNRI